MTEKTATKTCPECGTIFEHPLRYQSKRKFCSQSCCLKAWQRNNPEKMRGYWRRSYAKNPQPKILLARRYHKENRDRILEGRRQEYSENRETHNTTDRARWRGQRKTKGNEMRKENSQKSRLSTPWKALLKSAEERARRKQVPFSLTEEWASNRWTGLCELTKIEFGLGLRGSGPKVFSPSIDRIKPWKGYVPENCRFIIWGVNALKHDGDDEDMYLIAEALIKNRVSP